MKRIQLLKIVFLTFSVLICGRALQIQLFSDQRLERLARRQFNSKITSLPQRGFIFDRNGEGLAISLKAYSLFIRPEVIKKDLNRREKNHLVTTLAHILHSNAQTLQQKLKSDKGFIWLKRQLSSNEEQALKNSGLLEESDGIGLVEETKRFYPNKEIAAQVLGSVGVDGQGLEGLELFYDNILNGQQVSIASTKDAMGRRIFKDDNGLQAFKDGQSLVLTLDKAIQYEAEKSLKQAIVDLQAKAGSVIVAEVQTGEILAMANYPTFNPNNPKSYSADHKRNRSITDSYEPGSTFKPLLMAAYLEKGNSVKKQIYCEKGSFTVGDRKISEAEAHEKFEWLSLSDIIKFSSNIGAAKIALELGANSVGPLMKKIAIGKKTDIDLPGEASGSIDYTELAKPIRLANVGFGHGFTVTPLQMLSYYLALANGGTWVQPKLVKAILAEDPASLEKGAIRYQLGHRFDTLKTKKIFNPIHAAQIAKMLETVVQEKGTGVLAQLEDWPVAGKTGTAQKVDPNTKKYSRSKYITTFIGFAPARDPKLVALVLIDEPQKKLYAGQTAAPVFKEVMKASLIRQKIAPSSEKTNLIAMANQSSISAISKNTEPVISTPTQTETNEKAQIKLPDLRQKSIREVLNLIGKEPIDIEIVGSGLLIQQIPNHEQWLEKNTKVKLVFQNEH